VRSKVVELALKEPELSPRELAVTFTDQENYLKVLGWGWFYLSTILDDYSRYIISWKLCTNMRVEDVTDTLDLALQASGCDQVHVKPRARLNVGTKL